MAQTILAVGARNVKTGCFVATGGGVGASYGGALAKGDAVLSGGVWTGTDDTQAILDALNINRNNGGWGGGTGQNCDQAVIYIPPGNYLISKQITIWDYTHIFGEPSNRPTFILKNNSFTVPTNTTGGGLATQGDPFIVMTNSHDHIPYSTRWYYDGNPPGTDPDTHGPCNTGNTMFGCFIREINFTVAAGNTACRCAFWFTGAQPTGLRNSVITATAQQQCTFILGDWIGGAGGAQTIDNVTFTGNATAILPISNWYLESFRNCTFNGSVSMPGAVGIGFISCAFNSGTLSGGNWLTVDDCTFASGAQFAGSGNYHIENCTFGGNNSSPSIPAGTCIQYTGGTVYYNGASIAGNDARLNQSGVVRAGTAVGTIPTTTFPYPGATCVDVSTLGILPNGSDMGGAINTALASHSELFFPRGTYQINTTVVLGQGKHLFGAGCPGLCGENGKVVLTGGVNPVISATGSGSGVGIVITCIDVISTGANTAMVWNADPNSVVMDCCIAPSSGSSSAKAIDFQTGGGLITGGTWGNQAGPGSPPLTGVTVECQGPLYLIGVSIQEYAGTTGVFNGAKNVYWQGWDGEYAPNGVIITTFTNCSNIFFSGYNHNAYSVDNAPMVKVTTSQVSLWNIRSNTSNGTQFPGNPKFSAIVQEGGNTYGDGGSPTPITYIDFTASAPAVPTVGALAATVGPTTATLHGTVVAINGSAISSDGFDWGIDTVYGNGHISATAVVQSGTFSSSQLTGLTTGTTYHFRATANNTTGRGVSADQQFTPNIPPPFVQGTMTVGGTSGLITTLPLAFTSAQTATNTNVVALTFHSTTVTASVSDSNGAYAIASPLTASPGGDSQVIFWRANIAGGANTVTATLTGTGAQFVGLRIAEYSGIAFIDVFSQQGGTGATASVPPFTTSNASDVIVAALVNDAAGIQSFASGFIEELSGSSLGFGGIDFQDSKPSTIVSNATVPTVLAASANWVENVVAFSPSVVTGIPTLSVSAATTGSTTATLNGSITSNGNQTITADGFDWGTTISYGTHVNVTPPVQIGSFTSNISGLSPGVTYHYRSTAQNASGTGFSVDQQFSTTSVGTVYSLVNHFYVNSASVTGSTLTFAPTWVQTAGDILIVAIGYTSGSATVTVSDTANGAYSTAIGPTVDTTGGQTQYVFYRSNIAAANSGTNTITCNFSAPSLLFPDMRVSEFSSTIGKTWNVNQSVGLAAPSATTDTSGNMISTTVSNALIYGAGYTSDGFSAAGPGFNQIDITSNGNIHEYQVVTSVGVYAATGSDSAGGRVIMQAVAFVASAIPSVSVSAATVGPGTATLNGSISSNGNGTITADGFDWGTSISYGTHVVAATVQSGAFTSNLSGLANGTAYHYRSTAVNSSGTGVSGDSQFTPAATVAVPTLVQHVSTASNNQHADGQQGVGNPGNPFFLNLPNPALSGNCLILEVSGRTLTTPTVTDSLSNIWTPITNSANDGAAKTSVFVALNVAAGTQYITINFGGNIWNGHFKCSEFNNVASVDGSASAHTTGTGTIATAIVPGAVSGDLIWQCGFDTTNSDGWSSPITQIASGSGFTLLSADVMLGTFSQYAIQGGSSVTPTVAITGGTDAFNTVSVALHPGTQGNAMPPGIRIVHVQHVDYNKNRACQFPSTGNLLYVSTSFGNGLAPLSFPSGWNLLAEINEQGAWSTTTSPNLSFLITGATTGTMTMCSLVMYDIAGAAAAPFDSFSNSSNNTQTSITSNGATWQWGAITPTTSNGLIIWTVAIGDGQIFQGSDKSYMCDTVTYGNVVSNDLMDNVDGWVHKYGTQAGTSYTCAFGVTENGFTLPVLEYFGVLSAAFKAASITVVIPTVTASGATAIGSGIATLNGAISSNGNATITSDGFKYGAAGGASGTYGTTVNASTVQSGAISVNLVGLTANSTYHYIVFAINSAGTGQTTDQTFTTNAVPAVPTGFSASTVSASSISINWTVPVTQVDPNYTNIQITYPVDHMGGEFSSFTQFGIAPGVVSGSDSLIDSGLLHPGTTYSYRMRALDPANNFSGYTSTFTGLTASADITVPTVPGTPSLSSVTNNSIIVNWATSTDTQEPSSSLTYTLQRSTNGGSFMQIATNIPGVSSGNVTYPDGGLTPLNQYAYKVQAINPANLSGSNSSGFSTPSITITTPPTPPFFVQGNSSSASSVTSATCSFTSSQTAGDGNLLVISTSSASAINILSPVTDQAGHTYTLIDGPTTVGTAPILTQWIYFSNI